MIQVEVLLAWPDRVASRQLSLAPGATVAQAIAAAAIEGSAQCPAVAVHGVLAPSTQLLRDGDRVELLRPLLADPKDNRRRRARGS
ncbi:RnfH family protein [Stenotrophomonas rhizophila]|uniref:RnfH family protein n=1 Tax=Stenotrophomonas rhizophila TaxID=216778 RepID=UPI001E46A0B8|nr:RnfH family protein [Stenotrophomonas rhizophila]MCC7633606.1 RnfH family protein [Stenotrophomonas rhizophila]MCC7662909.1 RnfH family protein [Stenotrophomonas rhizophila]